MMRPIRIKSTEKAQSFVELALAFILMLIMLAGVIDLGRAFFTYIALRDAAQEGALYGSLNPTATTLIEDRARSTSSNPVDLTNTTDVRVDITLLGQPCMGQGIKVDVTYATFPLAMPFLGTIIGKQTIPIHATVTDTILRPPCEP